MTDWKTPDAARMSAIFDEVKNWGRWGADDEIGALNLITDAVRREAAAAVRHGRSVSCARNLPVEPAPDNPHPAMHMMMRGGDDCFMRGHDIEVSMDFVGVAFHGMATSHIDALCHVFRDGLMYNGFEATEVKSTGARKNDIMSGANGIVSRGVLLDMPRHLGVPWLPAGHLIDPDQLSAAESAQGVEVREGDILLVAKGRDARRAESGPLQPGHDGVPGLHAECLPWLHERGVSVLGSDYFNDALAVPPIEGWSQPIHETTIVAMGVHLLDNLDLSGLQIACAELSQWDFHLTIAPLRIKRGTGSPVNPIALL